MIVANKNDMENGRAVRIEEGQALARDLRCVNPTDKLQHKQ